MSEQIQVKIKRLHLDTFPSQVQEAGDIHPARSKVTACRIIPSISIAKKTNAVVDRINVLLMAIYSHTMHF